MTIEELMRPATDSKQIETLRIEADIVMEGKENWNKLKNAFIDHIDLFWGAIKEP